MGEANDDRHFSGGEDIGQMVDLRRLDDVEPLPRLVEHMAIEELQTITVEFYRTP